MRRRVLRVQLDRHASLVSGPGAFELIREVGGRPVWISTLRGYSVQEHTARDCVAAAETRGYDVEMVGARSARRRGVEALLRAPAPRWREQDDPGSGRW